MDNTRAREIVKIAYNTLDEKKAEDIKLIDIRDLTVIADYFVICTGGSKHQIKALQDALMENLGKSGYENKNVEGKNNDNWILMDYNDVIIHIFDPKNREFYDLERLWKDGTEVNIDEFE